MSPDPASALLGLTHTRAIIDLAEDAIISINHDQHMVLFNRGAERIFGYRAQEVLGRPLEMLFPDRAIEPHRQEMRNFENSGESARRMGEGDKIYGRRKDGSEFPAEASISRALIETEWYFTLILRDISRRRLAEERLRASLREKDALLKEIHHRVKNNLQVVSSLLGLQSRLIPEVATRKMFQESQNRVHSMALVHELLYQTDNMSAVDFREYVADLTGHLFRSYGVSDRRVRLRLDLEQTFLNMDLAVPCGLVLNELVSNSLKYAFPDGRNGEIRIGLRMNAQNPGCLSVADNGVGLPTLWSTKTLGLRLVRILADQMGATVEVHSEGGTELKLNFPGKGD
ncbi:MAG TPA: histidine kinase dimerization/phosphoacceptor domain -containing protein [Bryobacteraceae bacterium]|nr:histidine kinase dimerization/phosphoacceptor domain -containing protein [Bryobacteraceae bacterium]